MNINELLEIQHACREFWKEWETIYKNESLFKQPLDFVAKQINSLYQQYFSEIDHIQFFPHNRNELYISSNYIDNKDNLDFIWLLANEYNSITDVNIYPFSPEKSIVYADIDNFFYFSIEEANSLIDINFYISPKIPKQELPPSILILLLLRSVICEWDMHSKINTIRQKDEMPNDAIQLSQLKEHFYNFWHRELNHTGEYNHIHWQRVCLPSKGAIMNYETIIQYNKSANKIIGDITLPFCVFVFVEFEEVFSYHLEGDEFIDDFENNLIAIFLKNDGIVTIGSKKPTHGRYTLYGHTGKAAETYQNIDSFMKSLNISFTYKIQITFDPNWYGYRMGFYDRGETFEFDSLCLI